MIWLKYCSLGIKQQLLTQLLPIILIDTLKLKNIAETPIKYTRPINNGTVDSFIVKCNTFGSHWFFCI
jgi:hypothetical protein